MLYTLPVATSTNPVVVTLIPVEAPNFRRAKRRGLYHARHRMGIANPEVLAPVPPTNNEHQAATVLRQIFVEKFSPKMPDLNGQPDHWWRHSGGLANNDFKPGEIRVN